MHKGNQRVCALLAVDKVYRRVSNDLTTWMSFAQLDKAPADDEDPMSTLLVDEFFYIAWCWFVITFVAAYTFHPRLRSGAVKLLRAPRKVLVLSSLGQMLTIFGYYLSQFGYSWYYQANVVHACESSLNQCFNLLIAIFLYRFLGIGRSSAASGVRSKMASCVVVSIRSILLSAGE